MSTNDRKEINTEKLRNLPNVNDQLDHKYGKIGSESREKFTKEARAYYTGQLIENARKNSNMTQEEYQQALNRLSELFDATKGTFESKEADELALLVDDYEKKHYPIENPD